MPSRNLRLVAPQGVAPRAVAAAADAAADGDIRAGLGRIREELQVPGAFPPAVEEAAREAVRNPRLPAVDRTDLPLVTIDPLGSTDLDQAVHVARRPSGFRVHYAIADVAAFVAPGTPVDVEARERVLTLYSPDGRTPLHPQVLSEGAASLLPDGARPALLWTVDLDADGLVEAVAVERALVRSRAQLDYPAVQRDLDAGTAASALVLLAEVGRARQEIERSRGGVSLDVPEQEAVLTDPAGGAHWELRFRAPLPIEEWNAQISLLVGMSAAQLMLTGGVGILRTLPPADPRDLERLRRVAGALGVAWPPGEPYPDFVRRLDARDPASAAVLVEATSLFRGAGYAAFAGSPPAHPEHAAIAAAYAHATAPLRRLVDRFVGETCCALYAGEPVPGWVGEALPSLPDVMADGGRRAGAYERAVLDLVEAALLRDRVGERFGGVVVDVSSSGDAGRIQVAKPAVSGRLEGRDLPLGVEVSATLAEASVQQRTVRFTLP